MTNEQFPNIKNNEQERESLLRCFAEGFCPHCGETVADTHANDHLGFCNEGHLHSYQVEHATDVRLDYNTAHNERLHEQYLEDLAEELRIPVDLCRQLHDERHLSPAEIRIQIEEFKDRKAA
jgi:hypothetical protein